MLSVLYVRLVHYFSQPNHPSIFSIRPHLGGPLRTTSNFSPREIHGEETRGDGRQCAVACFESSKSADSHTNFVATTEDMGKERIFFSLFLSLYGSIVIHGSRKFIVCDCELRRRYFDVLTMCTGSSYRTARAMALFFRGKKDERKDVETRRAL